MKYTGVIFNFNGTLFWDTLYHNRSWDLFLSEYGIHLTDEEKFLKIHGKNASEIFPALLNRTLTQEEIHKFTLEKEGLYQEICLQEGMALAPGAIDLFEFLQEHAIPFTIATASGRENVEFFFEYLHLANWFNIDQVVYDDGTVKGKPNPDLYLRAMHLLNRSAEEVIVFEDAVAGIQAAQNARAGKIIIVNSNQDDYTAFPGYPIIQHFDEVDRNLLIK